MMTVDRYGLTMRGLRKAARSTQDYGYGQGMTEIIYNRETGEIRTKYFADKYGWTDAHYPECTVAHTQHHMTMQEIADAIFHRVYFLDLVNS